MRHGDEVSGLIRLRFRARRAGVVLGSAIAGSALTGLLVLGVAHVGQMGAASPDAGVPAQSVSLAGSPDGGAPPSLTPSRERKPRRGKEPRQPRQEDPYNNERSRALVPGDSMLNADWPECSRNGPRPEKCSAPRLELGP